MKLADIINIIAYMGPITIDDLAKELEKNPKEIERDIMKLKKRGYIKEKGKNRYDLHENIISIIIQKNINQEDLRDIITRRYPQYEEKIKLIGRMNELKQRTIKSGETPRFQFQTIPPKEEIESSSKTIEDSIEDALLSSLTDLIFNIPSTDAKELIETFKSIKKETMKPVLEILKKFQNDLTQQLKKIQTVLEALKD